MRNVFLWAGKHDFLQNKITTKFPYSTLLVSKQKYWARSNCQFRRFETARAGTHFQPLLEMERVCIIESCVYVQFISFYLLFSFLIYRGIVVFVMPQWALPQGTWTIITILTIFEIIFMLIFAFILSISVPVISKVSIIGITFFQKKF